MVCPTRRLRVGQDDDHPHYGARDDGHTAHRRRGPQQGPGYARRRLLDRQNQPPRQLGRADDRQRLPPPQHLLPLSGPFVGAVILNSVILRRTRNCFTKSGANLKKSSVSKTKIPQFEVRASGWFWRAASNLIPSCFKLLKSNKFRDHSAPIPFISAIKTKFRDKNLVGA